MRYIDGLGYQYDVPEQLVPAFERRRHKLLLAAIFIKIGIIAAMIYFL